MVSSSIKSLSLFSTTSEFYSGTVSPYPFSFQSFYNSFTLDLPYPSQVFSFLSIRNYTSSLLSNLVWVPSTIPHMVFTLFSCVTFFTTRILFVTWKKDWKNTRSDKVPETHTIGFVYFLLGLKGPTLVFSDFLLTINSEF